jgi:adenylate cyclase
MALAQAELRFWHARDEDPLPAAERALSLDPKLAEAHCVKARYLEDEGRADEAEQQIRTALKLNPDSWEANREAARMLFRHGHVREAIPFFEKAGSLVDSDWHNPMMVVGCYRSIGEKETALARAKIALERTERAISRDPTNSHALAAGANALGLLGDKHRAREWMQRALAFDPSNLSMRYNLACALVQDLDDPEAALEMLDPYFQRITSSTFIRHLEADPDLDPIRGNPRFKEMLATTKQRLGMATVVTNA